MQADEVLSTERSGSDSRSRNILGDQQTLGDSIADCFKYGPRFFLIGDPVVHSGCFLDQPVAKFVRESEVLTLTRSCRRIQNNPVLEERYAVAGPAFRPKRREAFNGPDHQTQIGFHCRHGRTGEAGPNTVA
jgi:hypothetical protein